MTHAETTNSADGFALNTNQIETFAAGLYQLAACDGIADDEVAIIREFVTEAGIPDLANRLEGLPFDPATAYDVLESSWLRKLFLQAALLIVRADGKVTDDERETLSWMTVAFGITGGYEALEAQLADQTL